MVRVYIGLQQTDLHCISASEALRHSLNVTDFIQLKRYRLLNFSTTASDPEAYVSDYLSVAFDLVNPNKETLSVGVLPDLVTDAERVNVAVEVWNQLPAFRDVHAVSLRTAERITSVSSGLVWVITVRRAGRSDAQLIQDVAADYVVSQSRKQGLLVNPLFETYTISLV